MGMDGWMGSCMDDDGDGCDAAASLLSLERPGRWAMSYSIGRPHHNSCIGCFFCCHYLQIALNNGSAASIPAQIATDSGNLAHCSPTNRLWKLEWKLKWQLRKGSARGTDQGTTSTRFFLYDRNAKPVASHQVEFAQIYPQAGWVEHDPLVILDTVKVCIQRTCEKARAEGISIDGNVKAIGITNQRETTVVWRKSTGLPLYNAIVWMDTRTSSICRRLEKELPEGRLQFVKSAGLPISAYFSAMKLIWLLESVPVVKSAIEEGDALFGTGGVHVTDCANAARTLLMDLSTLQWHEPTLKRLGIPSTILPRIVSNAEYIGDVAEGWPLAGVPIAGCIGDQNAAVLGQKCKKGEAKRTYGTGCFILMNTGETLVSSKHGLLTTISFKLGPHAPTHYALEGSIAIAGAAVQWLRDTLGIIESAREIAS
ncbi:hypothetical protein O6H91_11G007100 [Diphasiastrum complanatum]|uniref:Uncharacterized protein n=1 Tax=Diphasiastrum complanatum TaxID=34168 RepID=A0ACC2C621_DIPCM|nr:hypothetical protein O6H91_11G007100 [Diphasiastrum complanatum]